MGKDKFKEQIKKGIDDLFASIDELDSRKDEYKGKLKDKYNDIMSEIKLLEAKVEARHRRMQQNDDPDWEEARNAFRRSAESFKEAFENLVAFLRKSPPPGDKNDDQDYVI